jgi:hypothetical protein
MWTHTQSNRVLPADKAFSLNNVSYPAGWLRLSSEEEKTALGLEWIVPEPAPVVRAPIEREKSDGIARAKDTAWKMMHPSDWRKLPGNEIPDDWEAWRKSVKAEYQRLKGEYNAADSYEALDAIVQNWPINPDEQAERDRMEAEEAAAKEKREERENAA